MSEGATWVAWLMVVIVLGLPILEAGKRGAQ